MPRRVNAAAIVGTNDAPTCCTLLPVLPVLVTINSSRVFIAKVGLGVVAVILVSVTVYVLVR